MASNNGNNTTIVSLAPVNSSELFYGVECCLLKLNNHSNDSSSSSSSSDTENDESSSSSNGILKVNKKNLPLISIRGWMHQSQGFKVFTNSASFILDDPIDGDKNTTSNQKKKSKKNKKNKKKKGKISTHKTEKTNLHNHFLFVY